MNSLMAVLITSRRMWLQTEGDFLECHKQLQLLFTNIKHQTHSAKEW